MNRKPFIKSKCDLLIIVILVVVVFGCSRTDAPSPDTRVPSLPGQETVLAKVNGSAITRYDVDQSIRTSFGKQALGMLDADGRKKVLESLVAGRAIAQSRASALDDTQKAVLEQQIAVFREQMLIKSYLAAHTAAESVSQQMVENYYHSHLDQFGQKTVRRYEMIYTTDGVSDPQRDKILPVLNSAGQEKDWPALAARLKKQGLPVNFTTGQVDPRVLQPKLRDLMSPLNPGQASALTYIGTAAHIVRITDEHQIPARPLTDVSAQIRKILQPLQLKKAVKQASEQVLAQADVEYFND